VRVCAKCGCENPDPHGNDELWCRQCGEFLGFARPSAQERHIRVQLSASQAGVIPGQEAVIMAQVANSGDIVEKVALIIEGDAAEWSRADPAEIGLFPDDHAAVRVVFQPPRSSRVRSGVASFRLVAASSSDPSVVDRAEGIVTVAPFVEVKASLVPLQSAGPAGAEHRLVVENAGNEAIDVPISASEPGNGLSFTIDPTSLPIGAGEKGQAVVRVQPLEALDGAVDRTHPFSVSVSPPDGSAIAVQAVHVQEAVASTPTLVLAETRLHAAPGQEATTPITVRNRGRGGETYSLTVLGPAAAWSRVVPPTVVLPPPVRPPMAAADVPFAVKCVSQVDEDRCVVAEGLMTVDAVSAVTFDVVPARARGRWSGRYVIELENQGNATAELRPVAVDPEHRLSFAVSPRVVSLPAGQQFPVVCKARTRHPTLLGKATPRPFQVSLAPASDRQRMSNGQQSTGRDVSFEQVSVLHRKLTALMMVLAVLGGAAAVALVFFGSQIHT
jgi:hypothetical protein